MASGTWENEDLGNGTWEFDESTGALTVSGTGAIKDMNFMNAATRPPWYDYLGQVTSVVISEGITHIGGMTFGGMKISGIDVTFPSTLTSIGQTAFAGSYGITSITFNSATAPTMTTNSFRLGTGTSATATATVYTVGWGSDDVFTSTIKGDYTTFNYVTISTSPEIPVNVDGTWKSSTPYVNVDGTWKEVTNVYVNVDGTWKEVV